MGGGSFFKCPDCNIQLYTLYIKFSENKKNCFRSTFKRICPQCEKIYRNEVIQVNK